MSNWTANEIDKLRALIADGRTHREIAIDLGRTENGVRGKAHLLNAVRNRFWSAEDEQALRDLYAKAGKDGVLNLESFSQSIGRDAANVCRKAKQMGLPIFQGRKLVDQRKDRRKFKGDAMALKQHISEQAKKRIQENGHPRGALGMKHTQATKEVMSIKSKQAAARVTPEQRVSINIKIMKTRSENGSYAPERKYASWKAAWHEIGGQRKYYRSNWEANYAYYLQWLKNGGHIKDWKHEPKTFWFEFIKRGTVSYLPDFWVLENNGKESYHEVKGWMDDRSKTKIARMAKYHPQVSLIVIDGKAYQELKRKVSSMVPGWTDTPRDKRGL
jgi:hypothetical protein